MMMMPADDWVISAMSDDAAVVDLLFRLKQSSQAFTVPKPREEERKLMFVGWGNRKMRSTTGRKEQPESTGGSPTTPLSWSTGDGGLASDSYDESSDVYSVNRSKGGFNNDNGSISSSSKRSRIIKSFAELEEEENLQLKESIHLNKELENLRLNLEEQKSRNESLKRIKNDIMLQTADNTQVRTIEAYGFECRIDENKNRDGKFILPDLNMEPTDDFISS